MLVKKLDGYSELGSGWRLEKINTINLNIARYKPIRGGNSFAYTPADLRDKRIIYFLYSMLAQLIYLK